VPLPLPITAMKFSEQSSGKREKEDIMVGRKPKGKLCGTGRNREENKGHLSGMPIQFGKKSECPRVANMSTGLPPAFGLKKTQRGEGGTRGGIDSYAAKRPFRA